MDFLRSFGSRMTQNESRLDVSSDELFEDNEESRLPTPVENSDIELEESSKLKLGVLFPASPGTTFFRVLLKSHERLMFL